MHTSGSHRRPSYLLNASPLYSNSAQLKTTNKLGDVVLFLFNMRFSSRTLIGVKKKQKFFLIQVRWSASLFTRSIAQPPTRPLYFYIFFSFLNRRSISKDDVLAGLRDSCTVALGSSARFECDNCDSFVVDSSTGQIGIWIADSQSRRRGLPVVG